MDLAYMADKSYEFKLVMWETVERLQEMYPHYEIGWWGFVPMFITH